MATNYQYTPVSPQDEDLTSRTQQLETRQGVGALEREEDQLEPNRKDGPKFSKENPSQAFANTDVDDILEIPNWPGPQNLEITRGESLLQKMIYILLLVPPLFFLILVLSSIGLHSNKENPFGEFVRQTCLLGPTAFPIAFSAILGWCLKIYGRYRSERGVKLGELERVIGSQTLFSFLKLAFKFKQLDRLCIFLGLVWVLSPLGGQGVLRMLSLRQETKTSSEEIYYLDLHARSQYYDDYPRYVHRNKINGLYIASLWAPVRIKNETTDLWGSIKIPSLESIDFSHQGDDGVAVGEVQTYSSLLGIPLNSTVYKTAFSYSFTLNTTAFTTQCQEPKTVNSTDVPSPSPGSQFILETHTPVGALTRRNVSLITFPDLREAAVHNCTITQNFLLAKVECHSGDCSVSRIKKLTYTDDQLAALPVHLRDNRTWSNIAFELPKSTGLEYYSWSQTERYLYSPQTSLEYYEGGIDLRIIPIAEFSKRFSTVLNAYYQATIDPWSRLEPGYYTMFSNGQEHEALKRTIATVQIQSPTKTYQRHWEWVVSALVASLVMLGVAATGIVLQRRVIIPDIYGHVSSMTRDNPYFPLPPTGCTLEGTDRAILLKDVVVRVEDVAPDREIGHLAFTMAGYKTATEQSVDCRLRKTKLYSGCS
ncbi:hypothetical protein CPB86DRAFT_603960 [Serendipita vermifera]|nr:hypothetical protein CPB86DRAFT_603960 [Serendipita vermifera]